MPWVWPFTRERTLGTRGSAPAPWKRVALSQCGYVCVVRLRGWIWHVRPRWGEAVPASRIRPRWRRGRRGAKERFATICRGICGANSTAARRDGFAPPFFAIGLSRGLRSNSRTHTPTHPHTPKGALFSPVLCLHVVKLAPFHSGLFPIFPFGLRPKNRGSFSTARPFCRDKIQLKSLRDNISSTTTVAHPELRKH